MSFQSIPLSLYIHIPWCIKKCPYCDFNSHAQTGELPEKAYIDQLIMDLETQLSFVQNRTIHSVFIGGGTPSLFSPEAYVELFARLRAHLNIPNDIEITLEANPGTIEADRFAGYFDAGINRISLGVQSFQDDKLEALGRIHDNTQAKNAFLQARKAGFKNINIDLMFGLPNQTINEALCDLQSAVDLMPNHISWYQLTLEPNTFFYRFPPALPDDDYRFEIQQAGQAFLSDNHFLQYEISAYAKDNQQSQHNLNYWLFGDYLAIGAGAHGKLTDFSTGEIMRRWNTKHPKQYLSAHSNNLFESKIIEKKELPLEFMMNVLRLQQPIAIDLFETRTGLGFNIIKKQVEKAIKAELLMCDARYFQVTPKGYLFLNELLEIFL